MKDRYGFDINEYTFNATKEKPRRLLVDGDGQELVIRSKKYQVIGSFNLPQAEIHKERGRYFRAWNRIKYICASVANLETIESKEDFLAAMNNNHPQLLRALYKDPQIAAWMKNPYRHNYLMVDVMNQYGNAIGEKSCIPDMSYDVYGFDTLLRDPYLFSQNKGPAVTQMQELCHTYIVGEDTPFVHYLNGYFEPASFFSESYNSGRFVVNYMPNYIIEKQDDTKKLFASTGNRYFAEHVALQCRRFPKGGSFCFSLPSLRRGSVGHDIAMVADIDSSGKINEFTFINSNGAPYVTSLNFYIWDFIMVLANRKPSILSDDFANFVRESNKKNKISISGIKKFIKSGPQTIELQREWDEKCLSHTANNVRFASHLQSKDGRMMNADNPKHASHIKKAIENQFYTPLSGSSLNSLKPTQEYGAMFAATLRCNEWHNDRIRDMVSLYGPDGQNHEAIMAQYLQKILFFNAPNPPKIDIKLAPYVQDGNSYISIVVSVDGAGDIAVSSFLLWSMQQARNMGDFGGHQMGKTIKDNEFEDENKLVKDMQHFTGVNVIHMTMRYLEFLSKDQHLSEQLTKSKEEHAKEQRQMKQANLAKKQKSNKHKKNHIPQATLSATKPAITGHMIKFKMPSNQQSHVERWNSKQTKNTKSPIEY